MSTDPEVEALLQTVPLSFAHFDLREVAELKAFHSNVEELNRRKLANQQSFTYEISTEGSLSSGVDEDDILALATTIRKLAWAQKDMGTFNRVMNILARRANEAGTDEGASMLQRVKDIRELRTLAEKRSRVASYALEADDGSSTELTPELLCDMAVNGVIFHNDDALRTRWLDLGGFTNPAIHMIITTTFKDFAQFFRATDLIVERVLDTPELVSDSPITSA